MSLGITNNLNPCVRIILCGLSAATLGALKALINTQLAALEAQIITLESQILKYDLLAKAAQASANLALAKIQQIRNTASLIPLGLLAGCTPLGDINQAFQASIDQLTAGLEGFIQNATRLLSFIDEINLSIAALHEIQTLYNSVLQTISLCGAGG